VFAEGSSVRAVYDRAGPLEGRDMLLKTRFWWVLAFNFPVRVGEVRDGLLQQDGRRARVWGWNYRTLDGHLEMGQMDYEVCKWLDSGEVEFRISAFSRRADIRNPIVRLGVRLFARREQLKFYRHVCERMRLLTAVPAGGAGAG
jgi:uncharacterized protein (UPF0548 family)